MSRRGGFGHEKNLILSQGFQGRERESGQEGVSGSSNEVSSVQEEDKTLVWANGDRSSSVLPLVGKGSTLVWGLE